MSNKVIVHNLLEKWGMAETIMAGNVQDFWWIDI